MGSYRLRVECLVFTMDLGLTMKIYERSNRTTPYIESCKNFMNGGGSWAFHGIELREGAAL